MKTELLDSFGRPMMMAQETDKDWIIETPLVFRRRTPSGELVTHENALLYAAVWACVRVVSETVSMLPWRLHRRVPGGGSELMAGRPVDELLHMRPNDEMGPTAWREAMMISALTWGNGYAEIERNALGVPVNLWPITPDRVTPMRADNKQLVYRVDNQSQEADFLTIDAMYHLKGPTPTGTAGTDVIAVAARAIGLGMAAEKAGGALFANGGTPPGFLVHEGEIDPEEATKLLERFAEYHAGAEKRGRMGLLHSGLDFKSVASTNVDSQFTETRLFQVLEICRIFRVPPHKICELSRATFSNITEQEHAFYRDTIMPWVVRLEREADRKLLRQPERRRLFTKINANAILRGSPKERAEFYKTMSQIGVLSVNDMLELEDRNPIGPEGDERLVQVNMTTLKALVKNAENPPETPQIGLNPPQTTPKPTDSAAIADGPHYPVILHAAERIVRREVHRVLDAAGRSVDNADFAARLDKLYGEHRSYMRTELLPASKSIWSAASTADAIGAMGDALALCVSKYMREAREVLAVAYDEGRIEDVCDDWIDNKPATIAETVINNTMLAIGLAGEPEGG